MADHNVSYLIGLHAGRLHCEIGTQIVLHWIVFEKRIAMKAAVEENGVSASANEPYNHGDVDLLVLGAAHHKVSHCAWSRSVTDRLNGIFRRDGPRERGGEERQTNGSK
jgi:hypothetical protein